MADSRATYGGTAEAFAAVLQPVLDARGKVWCRYPCEAKVVSEAKLNVKGVLDHLDLLGALHAAMPNLSFTKSVVLAGIKVLVQTNSSIALKPGEVDDYTETHARRLRNLCRCVAQAEARRPRPSWVAQLPWHVGDSTDSMQSEQPAKRTRQSKSADED